MEVGISRIHRGAPLVSACTALSLLSFSSHAQDKRDPNGWKELAVVPETAIQALSFVSGRVEVPKTTDGGSAWSTVLDAGSPYYWYGV